MFQARYWEWLFLYIFHWSPTSYLWLWWAVYCATPISAVWRFPRHSRLPQHVFVFCHCCSLKAESMHVGYTSRRRRHCCKTVLSLLHYRQIVSCVNTEPSEIGISFAEEAETVALLPKENTNLQLRLATQQLQFEKNLVEFLHNHFPWPATYNDQSAASVSVSIYNSSCCG